ncbi:MAG: T9SS type A sorting domain-containing protein [Bacteroidales bacterium]|nr:T9SS type A sorting domain-containing protein [Bacteroidales bacterium]
MKKTIIFLLFIAAMSQAYGQQVIRTRTIPNTITSSQKYVWDDTMTISGTNTIKNNATVEIIAKEVVINPGFSTELGTNVTIEAMETPALRSNEEFQEKEAVEITTSVDTPEAEPTIKSVRVYTVTGQRVYSSETHTDIYSIGLPNGIYVIQKEYDNGESVREKIILNE